jgi:trimeric autotransporter adhesin
MKTLTKFFLATVVYNSSVFAQNITTIVGGGFSGLGDGGQATSAQLNNPHGIGFDPLGNIYVADGNAQRIRKITVSTGIITTAVGTGVSGYNGNGIAATSAQIYSPWGLTLDAVGNIYFCDLMNNRIRKVTASTGIISNIAGRPASGMFATNSGYNGDGIPADSAKLYQPMGLAIDAVGNVYIADLYNNRIRKVTVSTGIISTIAGTGGNTFNGDGIAATSADVFGPTAVAVDAVGNVYIADNGNDRIRKIDISTGKISTICGNGGMGFSGDGGPASQAQIRPYGMCIDVLGNLYITDSQNSRVRKITASTGIISTIAGTGANGYSGDGGPATQAQIVSTSGVAVDAAGNVYLSDSGNNRVRKISASTVGVESFADVTIGLSVFPNPFNASTVISFDNEQTNITVFVKDMQGKLLKQELFSGKEFSLSKSGLSAGVYVLEISKAGKPIANNKIVVE